MTKIDGRGKAPKAGKGVGRKRLAPELKKEETKTVSIRLPVSSIKFHGIDGAWLFDAAMQKISAKTGLNYIQLYDPEYREVPDVHADLRARLIDLLSAEIDGETCYKDEQSYQIAGVLKDIGVL